MGCIGLCIGAFIAAWICSATPITTPPPSHQLTARADISCYASSLNGTSIQVIPDKKCHPLNLVEYDDLKIGPACDCRTFK